MYKHLVVAVDGSATSLNALQHACSLAKMSQGKLTLVHVANPSEYMAMAPEFLSHASYEEAAVAQGNEVLEFAQKTAKDAGLTDVVTHLLVANKGARDMAQELVDYASEQGAELKFIASCRLPTEWGVFSLHGFEEASGQEHVALVMGDIADGEPVLARIHSECLTGDALFSQKCDCGPQLQAAMQAVNQAERGMILYLRQEGRGIGLINKIRAYQLQDQGLDTVEANLALGLPVDARDFTLAQAMLQHFGVKQVRLLTNNPEKVETLRLNGIDVVERVPLQVGENIENEHYLQTKANKLGHFL